MGRRTTQESKCGSALTGKARINTIKRTWDKFVDHGEILQNTCKCEVLIVVHDTAGRGEGLLRVFTSEGCRGCHEKELYNTQRSFPAFVNRRRRKNIEAATESSLLPRQSDQPLQQQDHDLQQQQNHSPQQPQQQPQQTSAVRVRPCSVCQYATALCLADFDGHTVEETLFSARS